MGNFKFVVAYDGTRYLGWQKTKEGPSLEEELEKVLTQILQHVVHLQAASRTDAGVHAKGQVVNFFTHKKPSLKSVNALLPKDISVLQMEEVKETFHPTLDCTEKEYHYDLSLGPVQLPFERFFSWHYPYPLDIEKMQKAAPLFLGEHDFSCLCNEKKEDNRCTITTLEVAFLSPEHLKIRVIGNRFLYKMVRNLVGTLIYVGAGKILVDQILPILQSKERARAGVTAPAHGLCLHQVNYVIAQ